MRSNENHSNKNVSLAQQVFLSKITISIKYVMYIKNTKELYLF